MTDRDALRDALPSYGLDDATVLLTTETRAIFATHTEAGKRLLERSDGMWFQPNPLAGANAMQSASIAVKEAILAIEAEARADLLAQIEKAAEVLDQSGGDRYAIEARGILRAAIRSAAPVEPT